MLRIFPGKGYRCSKKQKRAILLGCTSAAGEGTTQETCRVIPSLLRAMEHRPCFPDSLSKASQSSCHGTRSLAFCRPTPLKSPKRWSPFPQRKAFGVSLAGSTGSTEPLSPDPPSRRPLLHLRFHSPHCPSLLWAAARNQLLGV